MSMTRRSLIKSSAALSALAPAAAIAAREKVVTIYDSRIPESRHFARSRHGSQIDIAHQDAALWRDLRTAVPRGRIEGLTGWNDLVLVRGLLEEQGKRLTEEHQTRGLFRWSMA